MIIFETILNDVNVGLMFVGQNFSWLQKVGQNLNDNEQETSEMQFEDFALKTNARDFESRLQAKAKPTKTYFCQLIPKKYTYWEKNLDWLNNKNIRSLTTQCRRIWSIFFVMAVYLQKMMERLHSGE